MLRLFNQIGRICRQESRLRILDTELTLRSDNRELLSCFEHGINCGQLPRSADKTQSVECIVAYRRPELALDEFGFSDPPREVFQPEYGIIKLWLREGFALLVLDGLGLVAVHPEHGFLCLIEPPDPAPRADRQPNLPFMANIILAEILSQSGRFLIHGAGAGRAGRCTLWVGPSGAGKTTQVLRMVANGWDFFGDDLLIVGKDPAGDWRVWPVWRNAKVTADTRRLIPRLRVLSARPQSDGKFSLDVKEEFGISMPEAAIVDSINVLTAQEQTERVDLTLQEAFEMIAPCFLHYLWAGNASGMMENLFDLVSTRPVHLLARARLDAAEDHGSNTGLNDHGMRA